MNPEPEAAVAAAEWAENLSEVAIVNPHPSEVDDVAHHVPRGTAAVLLPQLLDPGA